MSDAQRTTGERLSKRVAALQGCSRSEAERLIEGGWVRVNDQLVTDPAHRVQHESIAVDADARPQALVPVALAWHKPVGVELAPEQALQGCVTPSDALLPWHTRHLRCITPMPAAASGLALFVQDPRALRQAREEAPWAEHEWMLDIAAPVSPEQLDTLRTATHTLSGDTRAAPALKLSVSSQNAQRTRLRLAIKGYDPQRLVKWLAQAGLKAAAWQRLRVGRQSLGQLSEGSWRILPLHERL